MTTPTARPLASPLAPRRRDRLLTARRIVRRRVGRIVDDGRRARRRPPARRISASSGSSRRIRSRRRRSWTRRSTNAMRAVMTEQVIPAHRDLVAAAEALARAVETSCETDLVAVQESFRSVRLAWDAARVYQFGPHTDRRLLAAVDWWPVDADDVEAVAAGDVPMTAEEFEALGSRTRGLGVIEYLLWAESAADRPSLLLRRSVPRSRSPRRWPSSPTSSRRCVEEFVDLPDAAERSPRRPRTGVVSGCDEDLGMPAGANGSRTRARRVDRP